jgi:hypothetical protein
VFLNVFSIGKIIMNQQLKLGGSFFLMSLLQTLLYSCSSAQNSAHLSAHYACVPYQDAVVGKVTHVIPGRIENEYYDMMAVSDLQKKSGIAEGICYHDTENENNGSGKLNKIGGYLKEFRMFESPDISYVKLNNPEVPVDDSAFNFLKPEDKSLYLGWIAPGEWVNYTVKVKATGYYAITTVYTSKFGGHISFEVDGKDVSGPLEIPSTYVAAEPIEWRQAHHWNKVNRLGKIYLKSGTRVLKLHFLDQPVMNFDYMEFEKL